MSKNGTIFNPEERITKSEFLHQTDIHHIIKRAQQGIQPAITKQRGIYADVSNVPLDPISSDRLLESIHQNWLKMPLKLRKITQTPFGLFKWLENAENRPMAEELGIIAKPPEPPVDKQQKSVQNQSKTKKRTVVEEYIDDQIEPTGEKSS